MQHATFHGTGSMESSKKSGSSDPLSLVGNKEEFTEGKASSIKLMNFYYDFKKISILNPYTSKIFFFARVCFGSYYIWHTAKIFSV